MQLIISDLRIPVEEDGMDAYRRAVLEKLGEGAGADITRILSKSLDMKDPEQFFYQVCLVVTVGNDFEHGGSFPLYAEEIPAIRKKIRETKRPLVVGFGPAGMFAALELLACGFKPLIFERGKRIEERSFDVERFIRERRLNPESNIQFGEGGAGAYSDGKLFSRRNRNTGYVSRVLDTFVRFGAPPEIAYMGKPHLGTDVLCVLVRNIRDYILGQGGEIHYNARMTDMLLSENRVAGIVINGEKTFFSDQLYLAMGHSARDTLSLLHEKGVALERRGIAVGVRIEHPAETINRMRYGEKYAHFKPLGAATYSLNHTNREIRRGVYTFCMCPGGEVVNAASEEGRLVLNGMSYSHRGSPFSNAALVVTCHAEDYPGEGPLAGLDFQRVMESRAFRAGGGNWSAPGQTLGSFLGEKGAWDLPEHSYRMGVRPADMKEIFPGFVLDELRVAFEKWKKEVPAFVSHGALLLGPETRTSSPVRIRRNEYYESVNIQGLYPIGEGSGYTGGITSSAADAIRAVERRVL